MNKIQNALTGTGINLNFTSKGVSGSFGSGADVGLMAGLSSLYKGLSTRDWAVNKYGANSDTFKSIGKVYTYGDSAALATVARLRKGVDTLKVGTIDGQIGAQTTASEDGKRLITINGYDNADTLAVALSHEAYRDGYTPDWGSFTDSDEFKQAYEGQAAETYLAVLAHTQLARKLAKDGGAGIFADQIGIQTDLAMLKRAEEVGMEAFAEYVGGAYDSSADYWKLTKEGNLVRSEDGWLKDENDLYINSDGTRTKERTEQTIGAADETLGLQRITGNNSLTAQDSFDAYSLFMGNGKTMNDVVYQAFQINKGYQMGSLGPGMAGQWAATPYGNAFGVVGLDESGIPIITTRVGSANAANNLVVGGTHGDERNAQRLIMQSQRSIEMSGTSAGDAIYFLPSLSPTLTFADARGVPNGMYDTATGRLAAGIGIPELYAAMNSTMRTNIQEQTDPENPRYGVDANRDPQQRLASTQAFMGFMSNLKAKGGNIAAVLMHGYDSTWLNSSGTRRDDSQGTVYPQYSVNGNISTLIPGRSGFADAIRQSLGWDKPQLQTYLYLDTPTNAPKYDGELIRQLAGQYIGAMDIELPQIYNEGVRPNYQPNKVGSVLGGFTNTYSSFLKNYWELPGAKKPSWLGW